MLSPLHRAAKAQPQEYAFLNPFQVETSSFHFTPYPGQKTRRSMELFAEEAAMHFELHRHWATKKATAGDLLEIVKGVPVHECFVLEDPVREMTPDSDGDGIAEGKIMGDTAIPAGTYEIDWTFSQRFQKFMPILLAVPFFTGIRMHGGNTTADTKGCLLAGLKLNPAKDGIIPGSSTPAINALAGKIERAREGDEKVTITITDDFKQG
jgi:hypothetical protein